MGRIRGMLARGLFGLLATAMATDELRSAGGRLGPTDDRPLTDQEFQLLQRLLSDPFSIPQPFKSWLVSYLEASDMNLPISAVAGLTDILGVAGIGGGTLGILPAGIIMPFGASTPPSGALMCDGLAYSTATQQRLFNAIGYTYGGSGATFNVPDLRGRAPVGRGTHATVGTLGNNEGQPVGVRRPQHGHTVRDSGHAHSPSLAGYDFFVGTGSGPQGIQNGGRTGNSTGTTSTNATGIGVGQAADPATDAPPYLTLNFIIIA